jgi:hypothetical protein
VQLALRHRPGRDDRSEDDADTRCYSIGRAELTIERAIINLAVDGLFYHSVRHENRSWAHYGRFIRLERGRAIEHTWMSEGTRGLESVVTVTFDPRDRATEVTLRHANLPDDEMGRQHKDGWSWYMDVLVEKFQKVAAR